MAKFVIAFLNNEQEGDARVLEFRLFHPMIVDEKKLFFKKLLLTLLEGTLLDWRMEYVIDSFGIKLKRQSNALLSIILKNVIICWIISYIIEIQSQVSFDVPLMAPVIAKAVPYWIDSILWWNELLKAWSTITLP